MIVRPLETRLRANSNAVTWLIPLVIGGAVGLLVHLTTAERAMLLNDEGTFLDGGAGILRGAVPYRDFFANSGPGTFWLLAMIFRLAGTTLRGARLLLAFDISVLVGLTYWMTSRLAHRLTALATSILCAALLLSSPSNLVINHRWDSGAAMLLAIAAALATLQSPRPATAFLAGVFSAAAAWFTPPAALVGAVIALRIWTEPKTRAVVIFHAIGLGTIALLPAAVLALQGGLLPMFRDLLWNASHYGSANHVPYGFFFGGLAGLLKGAHGVEWAPRIVFAAAFLLPAWLPPLALVLWLPRLRKSRPPESLLFACGVAAVACNYPRWDLMHLLYIVPVFLVLTAVRLEGSPLPLLRTSVVVLLLLTLLQMSALNLYADDRVPIDSPAGRVRLSRVDANSARMALAHVKPGSSLFVFPYEPIFYFLTGAHNPTQYYWMQPGMMGDKDERLAIAALTEKPPAWVIYDEMPPEFYLRIWPDCDPSHLHMPSIEQFFRERYVLRESVRTPDGQLQLLESR
jgi:hypothetical protein